MTIQRKKWLKRNGIKFMLHTTRPYPWGWVIPVTIDYQETHYNEMMGFGKNEPTEDSVIFAVLDKHIERIKLVPLDEEIPEEVN